MAAAYHRQMTLASGQTWVDPDRGDRSRFSRSDVEPLPTPFFLLEVRFTEKTRVLTILGLLFAIPVTQPAAAGVPKTVVIEEFGATW
jgi:hypothetical protein